MELNFYRYNGFGQLTNASEAGSDFSRSVSYGYDQRGLLKSITYPDEKTATYTRDALGRIDSVTYDGKRLADYYYLGDTVVNKTMTAADIEYAATVDALGRITGETFSDISTSAAFITNSYDYTSYSNRMDERDGIDYAFDSLGKLVAEDSTSYTSDILGNPTNAVDDGLTYGFDNENRIADVDDGGGIFAEYEYDRLGRRAKKTVDGVETHFVYDLSGNVIAEYENGEWTRDYVYGAQGEVVYMRFPQTTEMNDGLDNFVSFIDAWLCCPNCTTQQLMWDYDDSNDINLIDWAMAVDANDFAGAFVTNGRYLLTDFRSSVIGKVHPDGSVDAITYTAWGTPYVTQGTDLVGLSVLWNGYYFDAETGNYYLRNRYYSPLERRFLTEDPHGINPDENWNNSFGIKDQYVDGFSLQVYAQSDPVNGRDDWGLSSVTVKRTKSPSSYGINAGHEWLSWSGGSKGFWPNGGDGPGPLEWLMLQPDPAEGRARVCWEWNTKKVNGWFNEKKLKWGSAAGKKCCGATSSEIESCVSRAPHPGWYSNDLFNNCRKYTQWVLQGCCLKKDKQTNYSCP